MRKFCLGLLIFLLAIGILSGANAVAINEKPKNIILIGWDGAQRNHIKECLSRGELPYFKQLSSEGALVAIDILRTTDTKAGWAQILTGYNPEITGVFSNNRYRPIPKGLTVFERLEQFFGPDNFITVAVIGKKGNIDYNPGKPYYYTKYSMDIFINGLGENKSVGTKAMELLEKCQGKPFFFFIHFAEIDSSGHKYGENSKKHNDAYISSDFWTGKIIQKLKDLNLYDQTLIYITSDHGFDEGEKKHSDAPYVFLATNDPKVIRRGERADIAPTILERFGLDISKFDPPLDGWPLTRSIIELPDW